MRQVRYRQTTRGYLCHDGTRRQRVGIDEYGMLNGTVLVCTGLALQYSVLRNYEYRHSFDLDPRTQTARATAFVPENPPVFPVIRPMAPNKLVSALGIGWVRGGRIKRRVWQRGSSFPHLQASFWAELEPGAGSWEAGR